MTKDTDSPVNQTKLVQNARSRRKARENVCEQITIGFDFTPDWMKKWRMFFYANSTGEQCILILLDTKMKTALNETVASSLLLLTQ